MRGAIAMGRSVANGVTEDWDDARAEVDAADAKSKQEGDKPKRPLSGGDDDPQKSQNAVR